MEVSYRKKRGRRQELDVGLYPPRQAEPHIKAGKAGRAGVIRWWNSPEVVEGVWGEKLWTKREQVM
jgi:hypothetical protein